MILSKQPNGYKVCHWINDKRCMCPFNIEQLLLHFVIFKKIWWSISKPCEPEYHLVSLLTYLLCFRLDLLSGLQVIWIYRLFGMSVIWTWFCYAVLIIKILNSSGLNFKLWMKNINELVIMYSVLQTSILISILPHFPWKQDKAF